MGRPTAPQLNHYPAIRSENRRTAVLGPSGWPHTPAETAKKSAPAATKGAQLSTVIPPMATQGTFVVSAHTYNTSMEAGSVFSLVAEGKKAPKAT